jgi:hypothetical protein
MWGLLYRRHQWCMLLHIRHKNYPSSHKDLLAVKKVIKHFKLYLKPLILFLKIDLNILLGMLNFEKVLNESHTRVRKWVFWNINFDFDIEYKIGYLNCLVGMLIGEYIAHICMQTIIQNSKKKQ